MKRVARSIIPSKAVGGEHLGEGGPGGRHRQRVAGQRAAHAADVDEVGALGVDARRPGGPPPSADRP